MNVQNFLTSFIKSVLMFSPLVLLFGPSEPQEDKEPMFDSVKTIVGMLDISAEFAQNVAFEHEKIQKTLPAGHLDATTLADYLVKKVIRIY